MQLVVACYAPTIATAIVLLGVLVVSAWWAAWGKCGACKIGRREPVCRECEPAAGDRTGDGDVRKPRWKW